MPFDSGQYLLFLVFVWVVWRILPKAAAPGILLTASILFYASSNLTHFGLMLLVAGFNYAAVQNLTVWNDGRKRTFLFSLVVVFDVGLLVFYKWACIYLDLDASPEFLRRLLPVSTAKAVAFPLGLSFFTFQMVSCVTDVYRRNYKWDSGMWPFFSFAFFFPQISAGPIPRAGALVPQLTKPRCVARGDLEAGISLFAYGLFKKLVVANRLQGYADHIFSTDLRISTIPILLAFIFNALYIYADFSGYTDMARGAARAFGIDLAINFNYPFLAESVTDFWRRWHMTLSNWLKDYLYLPLVIRLRSLGKMAVVFSFLFTFLVCGVWHRLAWPFAVFGLLQGAALSGEFLTRQMRQSWIKQWPWLGTPWLGRAYVFAFFVLTNVMFRVTSLSQAWKLYGKLFSLSRPASVAEIFAYYSDSLLFLLNFAVLALWAWVAASQPMRAEQHGPKQHGPRFALLCAAGILIFGKLAEGGFVYVAF
jgi:alginate O-acetyltransferase complex protein AlgI